MSGNESTRTDAEPGPRQAERVGQAGEAGLDLSLGHIGTPPVERRWFACCDACMYGMSDTDYQAAEAAAGPRDDPRCPRCNRMAWSFHPED